MREYELGCDYGVNVSISKRKDLEIITIFPNSIAKVSEQSNGLYLVAAGVLLIISSRGQEYIVCSRRTDTAPYAPGETSIYEGGILFDDLNELTNPLIAAFREFGEELLICNDDFAINPIINRINNINNVKENIKDLGLGIKKIIDVNVDLIETGLDQNIFVLNRIPTWDKYAKFRAIKIVESDSKRVGIVKVIRMNIDLDINDLKFYDCERFNNKILDREVRVFEKKPTKQWNAYYEEIYDKKESEKKEYALNYLFSNIKGKKEINRREEKPTKQLQYLLNGINIKI